AYENKSLTNELERLKREKKQNEDKLEDGKKEISVLKEKLKELEKELAEKEEENKSLTENLKAKPKCTCPPDIAELVKAASGSLVPLYRYLGSSNGTNHFYTTSPDEIGTTTPGQIDKRGYRSEGIAAYIYADPPLLVAPAVVPLYRYYHEGIRDHLYTTDFNELACGEGNPDGYNYEGIQGYCFKNSLPGINRPLYRYWSDNANDHFYTTNESEIGTTTRESWL
ncbi:PREDICTED: uncharacterized protein LOC109591703, partial [Amphimedon queenslandica]|uniref:DUF5648 domain-containing protein n=2 Tax=Amphimedon queenslandica TaxID=400682 RepID=A0AAN0K190_AMPQE